jgi:O-antigen/teichoic acid export membrane protein
MSTARQVLKNSFFIAFSNIATKIIAFGITVYLARYLGVVDFGKYTFIITYLMMFGFIAGFGLDTVVIRDISRNIKSISKIMSNAITIRIITSCISILLAVIVIEILNYSADTAFYVYLASCVLLFQGLSYLIESLFQSQLKMHFSAVSQILSKLLFGILVYYIIENDLGFTFIIVAYLASEALRTIISFIYSRRIQTYGIQLDVGLIKYLLKQSLPFVVGYGLFVLYNRFDILMLSIMQGDAAVGFYSAAYKLTESVLFIPSALAATLMPVMAKQFDKNKSKLDKTYNLGTRYIFMLLLPITLGGIILGKDIISLIYTEDFSNSIYVFQILTLTIIFNSLNSIQTSVLVSANRQQLNNISVSACALLNITLNFLLIPKYSYIGAAYATLISVICLYSFGFYFIYTKLNMQPLNLQLSKYVVASFVMTSIILYLEIGLISSIVIGAFVYTFAVLILKGVNKDDIQLLR